MENFDRQAKLLELFYYFLDLEVQPQQETIDIVLETFWPT